MKPDFQNFQVVFFNPVYLVKFVSCMTCPSLKTQNNSFN